MCNFDCHENYDFRVKDGVKNEQYSYVIYRSTQQHKKQLSTCDLFFFLTIQIVALDQKK